MEMALYRIISELIGVCMILDTHDTTPTQPPPKKLRTCAILMTWSWRVWGHVPPYAPPPWRSCLQSATSCEAAVDHHENSIIKKVSHSVASTDSRITIKAIHLQLQYLVLYF